MFGNGPPAIFCRTPALWRIRTRSTPSRGSQRTRHYAAAAGQRRPGCCVVPGVTFIPPTGAISGPGFVRVAFKRRRPNLMNATLAQRRLTLMASGSSIRVAGFARDVREGLTDNPKHLSCRYFYDGGGSYLFEAICAL